MALSLDDPRGWGFGLGSNWARHAGDRKIGLPVSLVGSYTLIGRDFTKRRGQSNIDPVVKSVTIGASEKLMLEGSPEITNQLKKKDEVKGKVIKTTLAGAVVDIGLDNPAVIPISQLRGQPVRRVEDVVKEGDEVQAWVRRVDSQNGRIELTLIKPLFLEWRELKKDMVLKGKVLKLEKFGAFVELGAERPGLIHISEMSHDYVKQVEDVAKVGDEVEVKVLDVDRRKKQIKLSIKALTAKPETQLKAKPKAKAQIEEQEEEVEAEPEKPAPTAMEVALRKAMAEEGSAEPARGKPAKTEKASAELEDILARTLENRVRSK